jgi:hypothetical protein
MVRHETGRILAEKGINPRGKNLDKQHRDRPNFVVVKAAIDKEIAALLDCQTGERHDYRRDELERVRAEMRSIIERASKDIF